MTELPRVGIISSTPYAPPWSEGVRNLIRSYAHAFTARGLAVTVVGPLSAEAISQGDHGEQVVNVPLSFSRVGALRKAGLWFETAKAARELNSEVDVFLMIASATSSLGFRTRLLKRAVSKPIALYVTGLGYPRLGCRWGLACERVYVGNEFLRKWFPSAEVLYPLLPVGFEAEEGFASKANGPFRALFLGSFERERGVEYLLKALALAHQQSERPLRLILAWNGHGGRNYARINRLIDSLNIRPLIDLRAQVRPQVVYRQADVVVVPRVSQKRMAFPIRLLEAVHMGTPAIVSDICGMKDLIEGWGVAVPPRNSKALAEAILMLAHDENLRQALESACKAAASRFNEQGTIDRVISDLTVIAGNG